MRRIWQRVSNLYCVQNERMLRIRVSGPRSTSTPTTTTTSTRCYSTKGKEDETNAKTSSPPQDKPSAAKDLLSTLTGLKVEKNLSSKVGSSPRLRSAAADFRDLLSAKKTKSEGGSDLGSKRPEDITRMVVETAKVVAEIFPEKEVVESDLLKQLRKHDEATAAGKQGDLEAVSSILSGIKIEKQTAGQKERDQTRSLDERALAGAFGSGFEVGGETGHEDRRGHGHKQKQTVRRQQRKTLFDRSRLNIFDPAADDASEAHELSPKEPTVPSLWDKEEDKQLRQLTYSTINHGFDELIKWTDEGKIWHYPVDNEQGLEEEQEVPFHEHIFFDHLLEDLPQIEPIQNFMELVCVGLGQNPYLTVQQKHDHILWFKTYFKEREDVIREAMEADRAAEARETAT
ncbi:28S ribosomal protein S31, mitochondrial-like [Acanthaster planci]|uniref:Small ribosomal subunit protein mS31 n=1 Tax=Acanthaster planci TaxID=133434 RepID=A0A8B7YEE0_ACAPL|nr:28S ribosomal protein S31, mitochondrial-like [Acanthaster planci]